MKQQLNLTQAEFSGFVTKARSFNSRAKLKKWMKVVKRNLRWAGYSTYELNKIEYYAARWDR